MTSSDVIGLLRLAADKGPYLGLFGLIIALIVLFLRVLMDEDRSALWRSKVSLAIYKATGQRNAEKDYIANDIRGRLNLARRNMHFGKNDTPEAVSIDWVDEKSGSSYDISEGEFVVRLQSSDEQEKNIVDLAIAITRRSTLQGVRHVMEKPLRLAVTLHIVQNVLRMIKNKTALDWFFQNRMIPLRDSAADLQRECERMEVLDERGLFTRILLVELEEFAEVIMGRTPRPFMMGEINQLVEFLYRIATKSPGVDVPLNFRTAYIRIGVILVAKTDRILNEGIEPYVKAMACNAQKELNTVYVMVYDKEFLSESDYLSYEEFHNAISMLGKELELLPLSKDFSANYECIDHQGKTRRANCTRYVLKDVESRAN